MGGVVDMSIYSVVLWSLFKGILYLITAYFIVLEAMQLIEDARYESLLLGAEESKRTCYMKVLFSSIWDYLSSVWNWLDLIRIGFVLYFLIMDTSADPRIACISALLMWLRLIFFCRGLRGTGALVRMIILIINDIRHFVMLMVIIWLAFSHGFFLLLKVDPFLELEGREGEEDLFDALMWTYRLTFLGESEIGDDRIRLLQVLWLFATFFSCIVMLNLLIAIMGDTYARVQENAEVARNKEQAELVQELETINPPRHVKRHYLMAAFPRNADGDAGRIAQKANEKRKDREKMTRIEDTLCRIDGLEDKLSQTLTRCDSLEKAMRNQSNNVQRCCDNIAEVLKRLPPAPVSSPRATLHRQPTQEIT